MSFKSSLTKYLSSLSPAAGDGWLAPGLWLVRWPQLGLWLVPPAPAPGDTNRWPGVPSVSPHIAHHLSVSKPLSALSEPEPLLAPVCWKIEEWELRKSQDNPVHSSVFRGFLWRKLVYSTLSWRKLWQKIKTMEKENKTFLSEEAMDFKSTEYEEDTDFDFDDTSLFRVRTVFSFTLIHNHDH